MRGFALLVSLLSCACAVRRHSGDPAPTVATSAPEMATPLPTQSPEPVAVSTGPASSPSDARRPSMAPSAPDAKRPGGALKSDEKPRVWGRVAITTAIASPAELLGPEVAWSPEFKKLPAFPEKLTFAMSWGLVSVGEATLGVDKIVLFNGRPAYHLVSEARSNSFCDSFYKVRDLNEAWLDARTLTSLGYSKKLREGHFYRDEWVLYDRDAGTFASRRYSRDGSFAVRVGTIPAQVQDILSSIYYVRAQTLPDGGGVTVDVNTPDNWPLLVKVKERGKVKVPAGRFPSVLVEPEMRREGLFVQKGKSLRLWLSDDEKRRVLQMKVEVFFGHVTAALREML